MMRKVGMSFCKRWNVDSGECGNIAHVLASSRYGTVCSRSYFCHSYSHPYPSRRCKLELQSPFISTQRMKINRSLITQHWMKAHTLYAIQPSPHNTRCLHITQKTYRNKKEDDIDEEYDEIEIYEVVKNLPSAQLKHFQQQTINMLREKKKVKKEALLNSDNKSGDISGVLGLFEAERVAEDLYTWAKRQTMNCEFFHGVLGFQRYATIGFYPWFSLQILHLWMYIVRLRGEDRSVAVSLEQSLIHMLERDTEEMMINMGMKWDLQKHIEHCAQVAVGAFMAYDESLIQEDPAMADLLLLEALHRNIWHHDEQDAPTVRNILSLQKYIYKEMSRLNLVDSETFLAGLYNWGFIPNHESHPTEPLISVRGEEHIQVFHPGLLHPDH